MTHLRPTQDLAPPENGINASLFHLPRNLSGLKANGSPQYCAAWLFLNCQSMFVGQETRTIIVKSSGVRLILISVPAGIWNIAVSPAVFLTTREESSAQYFGITGA